MHTKMTSLLSIRSLTKMISSAVIFSLLLFTVSPFANCQIKAVSISLDILQDNPAVLNVVTASQLSDIIIQGVLADNDVNNTRTEKKSGYMDPNYDICSMGKSIKIIENLMRMLSVHSLAASYSSDMTLKWALQGAFDYNLFSFSEKRSLSILNDCLSEWLISAVLPRGYTDVNLVTMTYMYRI